MSEAPVVATQLPTTRSSRCPFDPPAALTEIRQRDPLTRMQFANGHQGWLATGHTEVRAVLADPRFSARHELQHYPYADYGPMPPAPVGALAGMDGPDHRRYRKLLTGKFTVRRMQLLTERIDQITTEHLDAMEKHGGPLDLMTAFARPIPALMICELLGVPSSDRTTFQEHAKKASDVTAGPEERMVAYTAIVDYVADLVTDKRTVPTDDLLSDLTTTDLTDEELAGIGAFLLGAGLDTTANMLALGTFALLTHPEQFAALRSDPDLTDNAVEELMRYLSISHSTARAALEDVELGGKLIRAGETVAVSIQTANRDPARFDSPDALDLHRNTIGHLGFSHGAHQCLGQQLARVEMRVAFHALAIRFPNLQLAIPAHEVQLGSGQIFGVNQLPVSW
ncbi:cytochrome P450 [Nocardia noduli]|uniref:cytochrome P450 n=1 Tax=Nocardia noduli TaxID=2815722 RepID=UPI001C2229F1|nr:cytochrome P450 [Nocardia noduli]